MHAPDLTDTERLILANQYEILSKLDPNESDSYAQLSRNLRDGYKWLYDQALAWLSPVLDKESTTLALTILGIYGDMKSSYEQLDDKSGIDVHWVEWPGFDGNNEPELLGFTGALIAAGRFVNTLGKYAKNSHHPTIDGYSRMIGRWKQLGSPRYPYTKEQIQEILAARRRSA
jgi:uncharacterized protein YfbU (UPF0304 family)